MKARNFSAKKPLAVLLLIFTLFTFAVSTPQLIAYAYDLKGQQLGGAICVKGKGALSVKSGDISFSIPSFPGELKSGKTSLTDYAATVTTRYELFNEYSTPSTATLIYPLGIYPEYAITDTWIPDYGSDSFSVGYDEESAELTLRHTFVKIDEYGPKYAEDLYALPDEAISEDLLFSLDDKATLYTYTVTGTEEKCSIRANIKDKSWKSVAIVDHYSSYYDSRDNMITVDIPLDIPAEGNTFNMWVIGDKLPEEDVWFTVFGLDEEDGKLSNGEYISGCTLQREEIKTVTLREMVLSYRTEDSEATEADHLKAVALAIDYKWRYCKDLIDEEMLRNPQKYCMRWYQLKVTVPAGESAFCQFTAPIYPTIEDDYTSDVYTYNYTLNRERKLNFFGGLTVSVTTPYEILEDNSFPKLTKTENGYSIALEKLPNGDISFSLSPEPASSVTPKPERAEYFWQDWEEEDIYGFLFLTLPISVMVAAIALTAVCYYLQKKKNAPPTAMTEGETVEKAKPRLNAFTFIHDAVTAFLGILSPILSIGSLILFSAMYYVGITDYDANKTEGDDGEGVAMWLIASLIILAGFQLVALVTALIGIVVNKFRKHSPRLNKATVYFIVCVYAAIASSVAYVLWLMIV